MKKIALSMVFLTISVCLFAQPPQAIKYQAVVRNASGELMSYEAIEIRISIHDATAGGTIIYQETHLVTTNQFGLITLNIGLGTPVVGYSFLSIDWSLDPKFIEVEMMDVSDYISLGTSELMSVPYSLYSGSSADGYWGLYNSSVYYDSGNVGIGTSDPDADLHVEDRIRIGKIPPNFVEYGELIHEGDGSGFIINAHAGGGGWADMLFQTNGTTKMFLESAGRLGIGTTEPLAGLHLHGNEYPNSFMFLQSETGADAGFRLYDGDEVKWHIFNNSLADALYIYNANNTQTVFCADQSTGRVGIGTTIPSCKLEVNGKILIGIPSKGIMMRNTGDMVDIESLGTGLALNFENGENTIMNVNSGNVGIGSSTPNAKLHVNDRIRVGEDLSYGTVYGELIHEGAGTGFKINAAAGGSWADMHLQTNGTTKMFIESSGKIGVGTISPIRQFQVEATGSVDAIQGHSPDGIGVYAISASSYGVFGQSSTYYAGYFSGPVHVTGSLTKGSGSFVIDHPLDPENKLLRHNFVESPENLLIYRGKAELNSNGEAFVEMPDYFIALTKEDEASIHLTPVGRPFLTGAEWNNDFSAIIIYGDPNKEVFWEVLADRDDPVIHELGRPVEEEKGGKNALCEKGKLLYPKAYGYPETAGRDYDRKGDNLSSKK